MIFKLTQEAKSKLVNSGDFRSFIKTYMDLRSEQGRRYGYSDLSRNSGFVSRSFLRDVVVGSKKLTLDSLSKLNRGMGLSKELTQYFVYLVELELDTCRTDSKSTDEIRKHIKNLKSRILQKERTFLKKADDPFSTDHLPKVFASLGKEETGATATEIITRTRLTNEAVHSALVKLEEMGLVIRKGTRYFSQIHHPSLQHLTESAHFKRFMKHNLSEALSHIEQDYVKAHCLYFNSYFCISSKNAPRFKEELRSLLLKYVDESDEPEGDSVVSLTCTLR